jgi:hypothetical protein
MLRRLCRCTLPAALLGVALSCASIIGADEDVTDAAAELCKCVQSDANLAQALGPPGVCAAELSRRLEAAREDVRAAWLERYVDVCDGKCGTESDPERWKQCFYASPTCSLGACFNASECCGAASGETCSDVCLPPGSS